jgi:hypothetical protein
MAITKKTLPQAIRTALFTLPFDKQLTRAGKSSALFLTTLCLGMGLTVSANTAQAATWQYLGGSAAYDQASGQPSGLADMSSSLPSNLLATVLNRLPEAQGIGSNPTALAQLTDDLGANIFLKAAANVKVSYVSEGAGYENSVGFFKFNTAALTTLSLSSVVDTIIFPNFSDTTLQFGKTVDLGNFVAGDAIGFTIVGNGWQTVVNGDGTHTGAVDPNKATSKIFRTIKRFNPESANASNLQAHTILFAYPEKQLMVLAFEDLNRQSASNNDFGYASDNDFNDVIIAIHVNPFSAVDCTNCNLLVTPTTTTTTTTSAATSPSDCGIPLTTTPIPAGALSTSGKKVNICHFPPGNPENYQSIKISTNALDTHLDHHDDVFRINGACPPISAGVCPSPAPASTPVVCTAPQVLDAATNTCVTPPPACTSPQVLDTATNTCVTPPPDCTSPQMLDTATNTCVTPTVVCTSPQVFDPATNACGTPAVDCTLPQVRDAETNTCVTPAVVCTPPQELNAATNTCETRPPVSGESGPISWREITVPPAVVDTHAAAKAQEKLARDAAAANGNGNGNGSAPTTP